VAGVFLSARIYKVRHSVSVFILSSTVLLLILATIVANSPYFITISLSMRSIEIPQPQERDWKYRAFEILPGHLTWTILFLPAILGIISPRLTAYFVIAYLLLWFVRTIGLTIRSFQGWKFLNQHRALPWSKLNQDLENLAGITKMLQNGITATWNE
jgi:hypothetical protein